MLGGIYVARAEENRKDREGDRDQECGVCKADTRQLYGDKLLLA